MAQPALVIRRGLTLIELLVSVAIIALLVGIGSFALSAMNQKRIGIRDLALLRSNAASLNAYTADNRGFFPLFFQPGQYSNALPDAGGLTYTDFSYFEASSSWHIFLGAAGYSPGSPVHESYYPHGYVQQPAIYSRSTPFAYPCAFVASPEFWNRETRLGRAFVTNPADPVQFRGTRVGEVVFPSQKSLVVQTWSYETDVLGHSRMPERRRDRMASVDGSGHSLKFSDRLNGYFSGESFTYSDLGAVHFQDTPPMLHTIDGVRGRDLR